MKTRDEKSLRLFYALWPDDATRASLTTLQDGLAGGRPTHKENLHLTLVFLGEQPATALPSLTAVLARLPKENIVLSLDMIGYFARQRIAWVGASELPDALADLHGNLVQTLEQDRIVFDRRSKFKPHVTLARETMPLVSTFAPIRWHADRVTLVQSIADRDGVAYKVLATHQLTAE